MSKGRKLDISTLTYSSFKKSKLNTWRAIILVHRGFSVKEF